MFFPLLAVKSVKAWRKETVLVIGAGMAGLSAARDLASQGYPVSLLEARDRIGGRVWTSSKFGYPTDLGASWIEGAEDNPIKELADEHEVRLKKDDEEWIYYNTLGKDVTKEVREVREQLRDELGDTENERISVKAGIPGEGVPREYLYAFYNDLEGDSGADVENWAWSEWDRDSDFEGDSYFFPDGYGRLTEALAQGLTIHTNQAVSAIAQDGEGVSVSTHAGKTFQADRVIVTLPLGVLKSGRVRFTPALPAAKQEAIAALGMGLLDKVLLEFPEPFWPLEMTNFGFASERRGEFPETLNGLVISGKPYLMTFVAGSVARRLEALSDSEVVGRVREVYAHMFGVEIPKPSNQLVTRWATDPWSLGSYSYQPVGVTEDARQTLAAPFDRVFFAGEATIAEHFATVHGAYISGRRAAAAIAAS